VLGLVSIKLRCVKGLNPNQTSIGQNLDAAVAAGGGGQPVVLT
jgi:hypothetical protein